MVVGELVVFGQVADAAARRRWCRPAGRAGRVAVGLLGDAEQDLDERGLAGAVLAEQAVDLALLDRQRDALERLDAAVVLAEFVRLDHRHGRLRERGGRVASGEWDSPIGREY